MHDRHRVIIDELRGHVARLEEHFTKSQSEMAYVQQQLEFVVVSLEKERGIVADHTEQLRLFAGEATRHGGLDHGGAASKPLVLVLANWLYMPVIHFAKGFYTLLYPIINTAQSLSLFNSEVLQRYTNEHLRSRWNNERKGDLLDMLQRGTYDPAPHAAFYKPSATER
ncbi:hypothetical protein STCU_02212 [Strigomonas culicis]|nr:hypothetical protein STCU_02212 [Strigomonas culicis]|eukprot:EPY33450.1 hypothetical protein STCU_02212 [Strigomonas culicis]